jgi:hypothetical protein
MSLVIEQFLTAEVQKPRRHLRVLSTAATVRIRSDMLQTFKLNLPSKCIQI